MAFYSDDIIQQLKAETDIAQVIQQFIPLKPSGTGRFVGKCPFHDDKKPSMSVNSALGIYKCFACGAGGDVFKFVTEHEKTDFRSAVEWVAQIIGFRLPDLNVHSGHSNEKPEVAEEREIVKELNALAVAWFEEQLAKSPEVLAYLENRKISAEIQKLFRFGYAPAGREGFLSYAAKKGFSPKKVVEAGLAVERENGGISDKFRDRLMIPIQNRMGTVIAFGGRILKSDPSRPNVPKYMNSPETELYQKREVLFGFFQSRQSIAREQNVIIVEGYFDLISLYQAGIRNVVAASGTALTEQHARLLSPYVHTAYLVFDGDEAGRKATLRSLETILAKSIVPKVFALSRPNGEKIDPDNFIQERGADAFKEELKKALDWFDYLEQTFPRSTPQERATFITHAKTLIASIPDAELAGQYLRLLVERYGTNLSLPSVRPVKHFVKQNLKSNGNGDSASSAALTPKDKQAEFETKESEQVSDSVPWQFILPREMRYLNLILNNENALRIALIFYDIPFMASGISLLESPCLGEILEIALLEFKEQNTLNLKTFAAKLNVVGQEILMNLPQETWKENSADREFLETTLDLELRFVKRLRQQTDDIEFKLELTQFANKLKKCIQSTRKNEITLNAVLETMIQYRESIVLFNQSLQGN